jgi:hypothetical protein
MERLQNRQLIDTTRKLIGWCSASSAAKRWWTELEGANQSRPELVMALGQALARRGASVDDFFLVCAYSNRIGVRENLKMLEQSLQDHHGRIQIFDQANCPCARHALVAALPICRS